MCLVCYVLYRYVLLCVLTNKFLGVRRVLSLGEDDLHVGPLHVHRYRWSGADVTLFVFEGGERYECGEEPYKRWKTCAMRRTGSPVCFATRTQPVVMMMWMWNFLNCISHKHTHTLPPHLTSVLCEDQRQLGAADR